MNGGLTYQGGQWSHHGEAPTGRDEVIAAAGIGFAVFAWP